MLCMVKDLSPEQRLAIEGLLGRQLAEDEGLSIHPTKILKEAPVGEERTRAYQQVFASLDKMEESSKNVSEEEMEALINEACEYARAS